MLQDINFLCRLPTPTQFFFFFFNDTATTEIYTLSLHDALPIFWTTVFWTADPSPAFSAETSCSAAICRAGKAIPMRSEEHTSELQSLTNLVCRLLLEKKKMRMHTPSWIC